MSDFTTIQVDKAVIRTLKRMKKYPRETYNELILSLIDAAKRSTKRGGYDEFIHNAQQLKMKELWDNKEDEAWADA